MANSKLTGLTATTTPVSTDIFYIVTDPGGTPTSLKVTGANMGKALTLVGKVTITQPTTSATLTIPDGLTLNAGPGGTLTALAFTTPAANVATFLATPSSANLLAAVTDETGTGLLVFNTSPTLVTPVLGVASATSLSITGTAGAGFIELLSQSAVPTVGASGYREYADSTGRRSWIRASDGFTRTWDATLTANRVYTLPNASITIAGIDLAQTFTALQTFTTSITVPLVIGGTTTTSTLSLRSTSGVGTTGADIIFQTGNNGATEVMRVRNDGMVHIGPLPSAMGSTLSVRKDQGAGATTSMLAINANSAGATSNESRNDLGAVMQILKLGSTFGTLATGATSNDGIIYNDGGSSNLFITNGATGNVSIVAGGVSTPQLVITNTTITSIRKLVITIGANSQVLTSTGYSVTGSGTTPMVDLAGTLNTSGIATVFKLATTVTSGAAAFLMDILGGGSGTTSYFKIAALDGTATFGAKLDISAIAAGSPNLVVTATSDTPTVVWSAIGTFIASTAPSGYMEITVGGNSRYIPFWA